MLFSTMLTHSGQCCFVKLTVASIVFGASVGDGFSFASTPGSLAISEFIPRLACAYLSKPEDESGYASIAFTDPLGAAVLRGACAIPVMAHNPIARTKKQYRSIPS